MAKKKFKRNIYLGGGGLASLANTQGWNQIPASAGPQKTPLNIGGALGGLSGGLGGIANGVATGLSNLMNPSGNSTGVGNALQTVGSIASNIPGVGGLVGAAVNLVGGAVNAAFGSNINEEFVDQTRQGAAQQASYVSNATDNSSLLSDWGSHQDMAHVSQDDVGTDGWFSNKAKNLTKKLNRKIDQANFRAWSSLANTASNIDSKNDMNVMANFSANGGPLTMRYSGVMSPFGNQFKDGGGIHIKKENRGKFTDYCGGKVTSECIARGKRSSSPTIRKRATFAANARKWKHEDGGPLNPYSAGALVNAIYSSSNGDKFLGKPSHNYDFTISEEEANKLGYYPDERGHRDDRVKKPTHPTHPSRGKWNSFEEFRLTDKGMENPNYTLFGLVDGGQDPQAVMTYKDGVVLPEITVTPKESYIMNPYDNIKIFDKGGSLTNKKSSSRRLNNNYKEGEIYDITEEEVKLLKELGYEFEYV